MPRAGSISCCAFAAVALAAPARAEDGFNRQACAWNGFPLYGDVEAVESFPDIKVQIVDSFPDLKVELVESFPDDCGQWRMTTSFPDVRIEYVDSFPDVKVRFVDSFPGWP